MFKDYEDLLRQMEFEMRRCSAEAMRRIVELPSGSQEFWLPRTDVYETETDLVVCVELAGIRKESLNVSISADRRILSIRGKRSEQYIDDRKKLRYHQLEVYFGSFEREVHLPRDIGIDADSLGATYRDGFLQVNLRKVEHGQISRMIPITEESE